MSPWFDSVPISIRPLLCSSALGRKKRRKKKKEEEVGCGITKSFEQESWVS